MIPFILKTSPKSNYFYFDSINSYGKPVRSMIHKPIYTCEKSKAMQDYENGISLWLESFK